MRLQGRPTRLRLRPSRSNRQTPGQPPRAARKGRRAHSTAQLRAGHRCIMDDMFVREWEDLLPHIEDELRSNKMKTKNFQAAKAQSAALLAWAQNSEQADVQDLIGSECDIADEQEALQAAWDDLQAVPSYVEREVNQKEV